MRGRRRRNELGPPRIMPIEVLNQTVNSGMVSLRVSSRSTGNLPIGHSFNSALGLVGEIDYIGRERRIVLV